MEVLKSRTEEMEILKQSAYVYVERVGYFDATCLASMCAGYYDFLMFECNSTLMARTSLSFDEMNDEVSALLISNDFYLKASTVFLDSVNKYKDILNIGDVFLLDDDVKKSPVNASIEDSLNFIDTLASMIEADFISIESDEYKKFEDRIIALDFILSMV